MSNPNLERKSFNFQSLNSNDVYNIALQRTDHLMRMPFIGSPSYIAWKYKFKYLLKLEAKLRKREILSGAINDIEKEVMVIIDYINQKKIEKIIDIGCGHGLADILFYKNLKCQVHLVDIEETDSNDHGYNEEGSGYASLESAKKLLLNNEVPEKLIKTTNPKNNPLSNEKVDLITSMISAGFHYPIKDYADYALKVLKPGGLLIFDSRKDSGQENYLSKFKKIEVIDEGEKYLKIAATQT